MEMYDVEALHVKQGEILQEVSEYVREEALNKDLYSVERDLFQYMLLSASLPDPTLTSHLATI